MGIFNKKVNLEEFCRDFYNKKILSPIPKDIKLNNVSVDMSKEKIIEADSKFSKITDEQMLNELIPLSFEMFALAWIHKRSLNKSALRQSSFTKKYLAKKID